MPNQPLARKLATGENQAIGENHPGKLATGENPSGKLATGENHNRTEGHAGGSGGSPPGLALRSAAKSARGRRAG